MHQIGEVAEMVGLSLRTIRHWDEVGLVPPSGRSPGGFRLYTDDDVKRVLIAKHMKPLGLSLEEMASVLESLDRLSSGAHGRERAELIERLVGFSDFAEASCARLREQLLAAEDLASTLRHAASSQLAGAEAGRRARR